MSDWNGGDSERVAPIIPLFGAGTPSDRHPARGAAARRSAEEGSSFDSRLTGDPGSGSADARTASTESTPPRLRALRNASDEPSAQDGPSPGEVRGAAEEALVRKLRSRSLSVSEARLILRGHGLAGEQLDDVIDEFRRRGYLDDAVLAEMLVTSGVERKGQGRVALSRALAQRGIPRSVIDSALDELPDDDDERALDFARTKARSMGRLDHDTALRRLVGQLSRRGYNGKVAMTAAKAALSEVSGTGSPGVRFVDSD